MYRPHTVSTCDLVIGSFLDKTQTYANAGFTHSRAFLGLCPHGILSTQGILTGCTVAYLLPFSEFGRQSSLRFSFLTPLSKKKKK